MFMVVPYYPNRMVQDMVDTIGEDDVRIFRGELLEALDASQLSAEPARFVARVKEAIREMRGAVAVGAPEEQLDERTVEFLRSGGLDMSPARQDEPDPVAGTAARYAALLADSTDVAGVVGRLGVDESRVRRLLRERAIFGFKEEDGWRVPIAQFDVTGQVRGLRQVFVGLRDGLHPVSAWRWLTLPNEDLELEGQSVSPLDWLRSGGDIQLVRSLAEDL